VGNLFGRPALGEQRQHGPAKPVMDREGVRLPWTMDPPVGALMGWDGPIGDGVGAGRASSRDTVLGARCSA
jgi:hypothetical protein